MDLFNRELSWLSFNERVLQESLDESNPIVERIRFLGIYSNNMDEFFRVRVASVRRLIAVGKRKVEGFPQGPKALLNEIKNVVLKQQQMFEKSYEQILKEMKDKHVLHTDHKHLDETELEFIQNFFQEQIRPFIVPIILSTKRKFPQLSDDGIYLCIKMTHEEKEKVKYALIEIPDSVTRFVRIPRKDSGVEKVISGIEKVILIDDVIRMHLSEIFSIFAYDTFEAYTFKITRDAELDMDDDISKSFLEKMQESIESRSQGETVRFVYDSAMPKDMLYFLIEKQKLEPGENIIPGGRYHNFKDFMAFPDFGRKSFVYKPKEAAIHPEFKDNTKSTLKKILQKDVLITYPYQSFQHVIDVLREAAIDPKVTSIKINVYRVAKNSQIINALISAARNGKRVTVVIELRARFDEANNIRWSEELEDHGIKVVFGVPNMKVHSKLFLIKRKSSNGKSQMIAHVGTGNFHEKTAKIYTDCSLLTSDDRITKEVDKVFKIFKNSMDRSVYRELMVSPFNTRRKMMALIDNEIKFAKKGQKAYIYIKLNNLVDSSMIKKLYDASKAGVKIKGVIRGICALKPGVEGLSENITVRSVVGRYLEHSRILIFANGGNEKYFISSADWMGRNLDRRIEVTAPIYDKDIQEDLKFMIEAGLKDNQKARIIDSEQKNKRYRGKKDEPFNSQMETFEYFRRKKKKA